jgi:hypothetical protein
MLAADYNQRGKGEMMHNKKKLFILVLSALLATACSKEEAKTNADAALDKAGQVAEDAADATGEMMDEAGAMAEDAADKADAAIDDMVEGD